MSDDLFNDDDDETILEFVKEIEYGVAPANSGKVVIADAAWQAIALTAAKKHGYTYCLLGHVTCPFIEEGEEAFAAAWYHSRNLGQKEFIEQIPPDNLFGSQFEKGM